MQTLLPWLLLGICLATLVGMTGAAFHATDRRALLSQALWVTVFIVYTRAMLPAGGIISWLWVGFVAGFFALLAPAWMHWRRLPLFSEGTSRLRRCLAITEWGLLGSAALVLGWTFL